MLRCPNKTFELWVVFGQKQKKILRHLNRRKTFKFCWNKVGFGSDFINLDFNLFFCPFFLIFYNSPKNWISQTYPNYPRNTWALMFAKTVSAHCSEGGRERMQVAKKINIFKVLANIQTFLDIWYHFGWFWV